MELRKKVVVITGAGRGLGRAMALAFADRGADVAALDLDAAALAENVIDTSYATTLGQDGVRVGTVEHLLAAFCGLGLDNVRVELDGPEVPIMDGSAAAFTYLIRSAGIRIQDEPKSFIVIRKPVTVVDGDKEAITKLHEAKQLGI